MKRTDRDLQTTLVEIIAQASGAAGARLDALVRRFGADGRPPATLAEAGGALGVTRERMRQIEQAAMRRIAVDDLRLAVLDDALARVAAIAPCPVAVAEEFLVDERITSGRFSLEALFDVAVRFSRLPPWEFDAARRRIRTPGQRRQERAVLAIAARQADASGATTVDGVVRELADRGVTADEQLVRACLDSEPAFEFLDEEWFWHRGGKPARNRLRNTTRRMLAVAGELRVDAIAVGLARSYPVRRTRGHTYAESWPLVVPPADVLEAWYRAHLEFRIDAARRVTAVERLHPGVELGPTERALVTLIRSRPDGRIRAREVTEALVHGRGMTPAAVHRVLYSSPLFAPASGGGWRLCGPPAQRRQR